MELFLAEIKYEVSYYEGKTLEKSMTRLVQASNADEAREKASQFIRDKTSEYSVYYYDINIDISEVIK